MQDPGVLHSDHVPGHHLQTDVIITVVHDVVKEPHGLQVCQGLLSSSLSTPHLVELLHGVEVAVQVRVAGKVGPVDPGQAAVVVMTYNTEIMNDDDEWTGSYIRNGFWVILSN